MTSAGLDGRTALHAAAAAGDGEMVALLLQQAGASVNALDAVHCTPLQDAVKGGHAELAVKFLRARSLRQTPAPAPQPAPASDLDSSSPAAPLFCIPSFWGWGSASPLFGNRRAGAEVQRIGSTGSELDDSPH